MKIAQIAPPWITVPPKNYGGTENVIYQLVEALVAQGHDVTLFTTQDSRTSARQVSFFPKALREKGTPWHAHLSAYYHLHKALEQVKEQAFDVVHTHLSSSSDMYILPLTASLATPHVTTLHSNFPFDHIPGWTGDADDYYMEWAPETPMVAISESARKQALEQHPQLCFVDVVSNGILLKDYVWPRKPREDYYVWLGRFVPEKGAHLAIEAAKRAGVPLVLAGIVDRAIKHAQTYFQKEIEPHLDGKQIRYIGPASLKQKTQLFGRARGFLNPIEWEEPFGMVMIEAMAMGCPVISFARGAAPEIVKHGENGFLVDTVDEMVDFIPQLETLDKEALRAYVEQHFSASVVAKDYVRVYEKVAEMRRQKGMPYLLQDTSEFCAPLVNGVATKV